MVGNVHLQDVLLEGKQGLLIPFHAIRLGNIVLEAFIHIREHAKHIKLTSRFVLLALRRAFKERRFVDKMHQLLASIARRVERS